MAAAKHVFIILAVIFPIIVSGKDFIVGDEMGWTINFDYQAWAQGKDFRVGDKLIFQYPAGAHNVFKVNGTAFQNCTKPPLKEALTSGNDTIVLATPGRKWYICGVGQHCAVGGQKLVITVDNPVAAPPTAAAPSPAPHSFDRMSPSQQALPYENSANQIIGNMAAPIMWMMMMMIMMILVA
ncbi:blue copper protein 1b-like [Diospyros lotus]|uniref:blue copper protein 1b-like n=1 Tax=Diospyros lotus TaxID=55363 RepID=UPI0022552471|nr:blue copper protein 1b-like [Diospyros lotus]